MKRLSPVGLVCTLLVVTAGPAYAQAAPSGPCSSGLTGSSDKWLNVGQTTYLEFPGAPNVQPASPPARFGGPATMTLQVGDQYVRNGTVVAQATKDTGPLTIVVPGAPQPPDAAASAAGGPPLATAVNPPRNENERVISVGATPLPFGGAPGPAEQRSSVVTLRYPVTALEPGSSRVTIDSGTNTCSYTVHVAPGYGRSRLVLSSGVASSGSSVHTINYTHAPSGIGQAPYIYYSEKSAGDTFVPVLASVRFSNWSSPYQLYLSGGFALRSDKQKQLFGVSGGTGNMLLTVGLQSTTVDMLQPGLVPNAFEAVPAGLPITFAERTTKPFAALTFRLCDIASLLGSTIGATCPPPR